MNAPYATPFAPQGVANLLPAQFQPQFQPQGQPGGQGRYGQAAMGDHASYQGQQQGAWYPQGQPQGQSQGQGQGQGQGQYGQGAMGAQAFYLGQQQGGFHPLPGQSVPHASYPKPGQYQAPGYGYAPQGAVSPAGGTYGAVAHSPGGHPLGAPMGMPMGAPMAMPMGGYAMANVAPASTDSSLLSSLTSSRFLKGLVIGGAAAYLLTNDQVQRAVIKGTVKVWTLVQGGVAELKERFQDAEAEIRAAAHPET